MDKISSFISIAYAVLLFTGGLIGFITGHSAASLTTGTLSALIVIVAWQLSVKLPRAGYLFVASISLVLCMFFLQRFAVTHSFMPGGLMLVLSTITLVASTTGSITYTLKLKREKQEALEKQQEETPAEQ